MHSSKKAQAIMKTCHPDRVQVNVPNSNLILVIGQDEFGCVELSLNMKQQKLSQDVSIPNGDLTNIQLEDVRINHAFRVCNEFPDSTVHSLSRLGLIRPVMINAFQDQSFFALAGEAHNRWKALVKILIDAEAQESESLST